MSPSPPSFRWEVTQELDDFHQRVWRSPPRHEPWEDWTPLCPSRALTSAPTSAKPPTRARATAPCAFSTPSLPFPATYPPTTVGTRTRAALTPTAPRHRNLILPPLPPSATTADCAAVPTEGSTTMVPTSKGTTTTTHMGKSATNTQKKMAREVRQAENTHRKLITNEAMDWWSNIMDVMLLWRREAGEREYITEKCIEAFDECYFQSMEILNAHTPSTTPPSPTPPLPQPTTPTIVCTELSKLLAPNFKVPLIPQQVGEGAEPPTPTLATPTTPSTVGTVSTTSSAPNASKRVRFAKCLSSTQVYVIGTKPAAVKRYKHKPNILRRMFNFVFRIGATNKNCSTNTTTVDSVRSADSTTTGTKDNSTHASPPTAQDNSTHAAPPMAQGNTTDTNYNNQEDEPLVYRPVSQPIPIICQKNDDWEW